MSLLPSLPDLNAITVRFEQGQGEIASKLDAIIELLDRVAVALSAETTVRDPATVLVSVGASRGLGS
jgi:hypothetical protein